MKIYLDIETIPGQSPSLIGDITETIAPPGNIKKAETIARWEAEQKPAAIEDAWRKTSFQGDRGEVVCIAWAVDDGLVDVVYRTPDHLNGPANDVSEADILTDFFAAIKKESERQHGRRPMYIGHNVRDFDLRFLFHRAVILGVKPPFHLPHDARPGSESVFDTMYAWAGYRDRISLDRLCRALEIPTKGSELDGEEIDGAKVWDFVRDGYADKVAIYCQADVERVRSVYRRLNFEEVQQLPEVVSA